MFLSTMSIGIALNKCTFFFTLFSSCFYSTLFGRNRPEGVFSSSITIVEPHPATSIPDGPKSKESVAGTGVNRSDFGVIRRFKKLSEVCVIRYRIYGVAGYLYLSGL